MAAPVAVVVVSWNTRDLLARCLDSLGPDVEDGRADVWVVDNASSDGSADLVRDRFPRVQLVASDENLGYGPAVNLAATRTDAPWLAPANADVEVAPGALAALLAAGERHPRTGAVAPRLQAPDGSTEHSVHPFPRLRVLMAANLGVARVVPGLGNRLALTGHWDPTVPRRVDWAHGAFLLVRREAWDAVGGFPADQWLYAEDVDLGWRLHRAGWEMRYEPGAVVRHRKAAATEQMWGEDRPERWVRATYAWQHQAQGPARTRAAAAVNLAGAAASLAVLAPLARVAPVRYAARRDAARRWVRLHRDAGFASRAELDAHR